MSNFQCPECGMINIDCGKGVFKTPREIELEKENEALKSLNKHLTENGLFSQRHFKEENERLKEKLKIAEEFIEFLANGKCSSDDYKLQSREYKNCLACFENKAQETLQEMKEGKNDK